MTDPSVPAIPATPRPAARFWWPVAIGVAVVAFLLRLVPLLLGEGLRAFYRYDSGVYFAAAAGMAHGLVPYRDFLLLHPPGIVLALLPFAAAGQAIGDSTAMVAARLAFMALGAVSAVLVARILRPLGWTAALVGGLAYACYGPAVYVERSTGLEALASFLTLAALALLVSRAGDRPPPGWVVVTVGALLGLSATVKVWGVVIVLAVVVWLAASRRWADAAGTAGGAALAGGVVVAPFLALAPEQFWRMVVLDQLGRPRSGRTVAERLYDLTGLVELRSEDWSLGLAAAVVVIAACIALSLWSPLGRLGVAGLVAGGIVLSVSPSWFRGYPGLIAGFLAVVIGVAASEMIARVRPGWAGRALAGVLAVGILAVGSTLTVDRISQGFNGAGLAALAAPRPGCVSTDDPSALIASGLLSRNLQRGCPFVVDLSGYQYHLRGAGPVGVDNGAWQDFAIGYFEQADTFTLLRSTVRGWLSEDSLDTIRSWPVIGKVSDATVRDPSRAEP